MIRVKMPGGAPMPEAVDVAPIEEVLPPEVPEVPAEEPIESIPGGSVDPAVARYLGPESRCGGCIHFLEPDACEIVAGPIAPDGVCSLFTPDGGGEEVDLGPEELPVDDAEVDPAEEVVVAE